MRDDEANKCYAWKMKKDEATPQSIVNGLKKVKFIFLSLKLNNVDIFRKMRQLASDYSQMIIKICITSINLF